MGASAGGLEALELFLGQVPKDSGMAFVIIQHLDPTRKGIMPELLQRATAMTVLSVKDRTSVQPDHVYVIPPNRDMSILRGVLHLLEPTAPRGLRLPIDFFFRSLALDQEERSIGVILSGMGSDGTLGLRAIKEKEGLVLVQSPESAKFDSMPRSAIDAGLADIVAPVAEMPGKIVAWLKRRPLVPASDTTLQNHAQSGLEKAIILLRAHTGQDFTHYKRNTLYRRIERRMGLHQIERIAAYIRYLQENSQELDLLFKELLIGVTNFFRDPAAWEQLQRVALPAMLANRLPGKTLRAWVPGCSTGEEAYSLAMILKESTDELKGKGGVKIQVFATDLDDDAIDQARTGFFPENIAADIPAERLGRFFTKEEGGGYRVASEIREMVIFAPQNLIMDPPFTKLDIVSCRNLLIYFSAETQKKLMPLFHYSLNPGGLLFLGSAETVGGFTDLFAPVCGKSRLFQRLERSGFSLPLEFPTSFNKVLPNAPDTRPDTQVTPTLQVLADQLILQRYAPPAVLVSDEGDVLYVSGRTGKYLEPAAGKANWNIFAMAREGLRHELFTAFQKALKAKERITLRGLKVEHSAEAESVDISVERLEAKGPLQGLVMIMFTDRPSPEKTAKGRRKGATRTGNPAEAELREQLDAAREETRLTREVMQNAQEELRSANEEMQSTNEELQSTNEELMTSKEEMQSLNEELQTVNAELQTKVDELSRSHNDMKNLLNSTDIATLFLDNNLHVRRFTDRAASIIKLIPGDIGRPLTDLASPLCYPELEGDARAVIEKLVALEKPVSSRDGSWFTVRIMPYRTLDNRIDGVVITFADITAAKKLESRLRSEHAEMETRVTGTGKPSKRKGASNAS